MSKESCQPEIFIIKKYMYYQTFSVLILLLFADTVLFIQVFHVPKDLHWLLLLPIIGILLSLYTKTLLNYRLVVFLGTAIGWLLIHFFSLAIFLKISWSYSIIFGEVVTGMMILFYMLFIYFDWNILKNMIIPHIEIFEQNLAQVTPNKKGVYIISESDFVMIELSSRFGKYSKKNDDKISAWLIVTKIVFIVLLPFALFGKLAPLAGILLARHFPGTEFLIAFMGYGLSIFLLTVFLPKAIASFKLKYSLPLEEK